MKACEERGDSIMEFIGPEIEENGGNVKKAIESVGDFVSDVVWNDILEQAQLSHTKSERWKENMVKSTLVRGKDNNKFRNI